jgi:predicted TIM-barrel fold metal-dependent hydrolase
MPDLFEIKDVDRAFYAERLRDFLPDRLIDVHTHIWTADHVVPSAASAARVVSWPSRVAKDNSIEDLEESYRLLFPGKLVQAVTFTTINADLDTANAYVADCAEQGRCFGLLFTRPEWSASELEARLHAGPFVGVKSYLTHVPSYIPTREIRIYDFFPPHQIEVLNRHGMIMMLHIPRDGRLRDPVNLGQMKEIDQRYPRLRTIIAHVGRAYCPEDVGDAMATLADTKRLLFDFSANTNAEVFEQLIRAVGPKRILFGSDLPIVRMRMRRICEKGVYINVVPRGLYGDVSGDSNMREVDGAEADRLTFFMYEELDAFRRAAEACRLSRDDIEDIFRRNAGQIIRDIQSRTGH